MCKFLPLFRNCHHIKSYLNGFCASTSQSLVGDCMFFPCPNMLSSSYMFGASCALRCGPYSELWFCAELYLAFYSIYGYFGLIKSESYCLATSTGDDHLLHRWWITAVLKCTTVCIIWSSNRYCHAIVSCSSTCTFTWQYILLAWHL